MYGSNDWPTCKPMKLSSNCANDVERLCQFTRDATAITSSQNPRIGTKKVPNRTEI